jgi:hypothetical protein
MNEVICYQYEVHSKPVYGKDNKPYMIFRKPDDRFYGTSFISRSGTKLFYPICYWRVKVKH